MSAVDLPAWSSAFSDLTDVVALPIAGGREELREWALGGATGAGVKVAVVDSGIDGSHPAIGEVAGYVAVVRDDDAADGVRYETQPHEDLFGHGTACGGIIRALAPDVELYSVRVLGANLKGQGRLFLGGIWWAVDHGMHVANMSLSSKAEGMFGPLHEAADAAYFGSTLLVCAANNAPGPTYPSEFASVVSVAARIGDDPHAMAYNPRPPVEFGARGIEIEVPWSGAEGTSIVATGNSFAAPHVAGLAALVRSKHPDLNPFQVKAVLHALADNAG